MKRLLLLLLLISPLTALAFPPWEDVLRPATPNPLLPFVELGIGLNGSRLTSTNDAVFEGESESFRNFFRTADGIRGLASAAFGLRFGRYFSVRLRADYDARGVDKSGTFETSCQQLDRLGNVFSTALVAMRGETSTTMNYITLSLLPAVHYSGWHLMIGPAISFPVSGKTTLRMEIADTTISRRCKFLPGTPESSFVVAGSIDTLPVARRFSMKAAIGKEFAINNRVSIIAQIAADFSSSNALTGPAIIPLVNPAVSTPTRFVEAVALEDDHLQSIQATIGVRINL